MLPLSRVKAPFRPVLRQYLPGIRRLSPQGILHQSPLDTLRLFPPSTPHPFPGTPRGKHLQELH